MNSPVRILIGYGIPLVGFSAFYWLASAGNPPGDSPDRIIPYLLIFLLIPATIAALLVHLALAFCSPAQRRRAIPCALAGGLLGPVWLVIVIATSTDPESRMGIVALPLVYFAVVPVAGFLAMLAIKIYDYRRKSRNV